MGTQPRRRGSVWRPITAAVVGSATLVVAGNAVWATLTASAVNVTPHGVTSGILALTMTPNGTGFTQPLSNLAPGDTVRRYVDVTNSGTLLAEGLTLAVASSGSGALVADTPETRAVRVSVDTCTGEWTPGTGACSGVVSEALAPTALGSVATPVTLVSGGIAKDQVHRLQLTLHLPDQDETTLNGAPPAQTVQGQSVDVTYTFTQAQRAAATTTS